MTFSASWGSQHDVCKPDALEDLSLENAALSPPLDILPDDVKAVVGTAASAAASLIEELPDPPSGKFNVSASGSVRQPDSATGSQVNITIYERAG
jgi:hypothetical protein